ncbi:LacI family DNA-binding transcriptional regulator [Microbacterium sp. NPDC058389]|uniref:LacI family DNA-binding transcriptional regulator n=1 Tax=Microbacterium sp. NPDC058389 TaxID=3346475 RepID=UPI00364A5A80
MATQPRRRATMRDVALLAGVSHQTVSRYLRDEGGLKQATVGRIRSAIETLDYHPDLVARSMRTRRTNRIAIVLPESTNWVPLRMLAGAAQVARQHGYAIDVVGLGGDPALRTQDLIELVESRQAAGVLSLTPLDGIPNMGGQSAHQLPMLVAGSYDEHMHLRGGLADGSAIADVVKHLARQGHTRFVHLAGPQEWASARNRSDIYQRTIAELGLVSIGTYVGAWSLESGYELAGSIERSSGVTAVIAANDQIALGAMRRLLEGGWRIPTDISVFGWNDDDFAAYTTPALSTVSADLVGVGADAMAQLIAVLDGREPGYAEARLETALVVRESSGPAPH